MSNIALEIGFLPSPDTVLLLKLGASPISAPQGIEGDRAALWNIIATYSLDPALVGNPQAVLSKMPEWPQGFSIAFSVSGDELPSVLHTTLAVAHYFGFSQPLRDMDPQDPMTQEIPDLNTFLYAPPPSAGEQPPGTPVGQEGTQLRQPAVSPHYNGLWFLNEVLTVMEAGEAAIQEAAAVREPQAVPQPPTLPEIISPPPAQAPAPVVAQPIVLELQPGAVAPIEVMAIPQVEAAPEGKANGAAKKAATKKAPAKKRSRSKTKTASA